jgi:3-oxoacyl-[acyl-carrier protein] reductase
MKDDEWNDVININLNSNYKLTKIVIKDMIKSKWGRIVNISSDAAKIGNPGQSNYVASKSAIEGLTRTIANEVASRGITVNCVAPGFIKTEILDSVDKKKLSAMEEKIPLGRIGNVHEIASVVYFLSSEESSYITGQVLHVNGGLTM